MMSIKSISCIIPAFNRSHTIVPAVESILQQDYPVSDIIVVDDGSSDDLASVLKPFDKSVRIIRHEKNLGASAARNTGIKQATTDYVAFLDSDDQWLPDKLKKQLDFTEKHDLDLSCTNFDRSRFLGDKPVTAYRPYKEFIGIDEIVWGCYTSPGSTLIAKRSTLLNIGGYDTSFLRYEDWDLLLRLSFDRKNKIGFLNIPLAKIYFSSKPNSDHVTASLDMLYECHYETLKNRERALGNKFLSAIAFNKASLASLRGKKLSMILRLLQSLYYQPIGNQVYKMILLPRVLETERVFQN